MTGGSASDKGDKEDKGDKGDKSHGDHTCDHTGQGARQTTHGNLYEHVAHIARAS